MMKIGPAVAAAAVFAIASPVCAQDAVQWRVEDGGNGHWYSILTRPSGLTKATAVATADALGAHLGTITSAGESLFAKQLSNRDDAWANGFVGPILGMSCDGDQCREGCWDTGEPLEYSEWHPGNPDQPEEDNCVILYIRTSGAWQNYPCDATIWGVRTISAIIEWSADCNSDGIVDYGQIRDGTFPDVNANGVPDCCEPGESCTPCPGDVTNGGTVDAADLSILLAAWGTNGQGEFDTDLNGDGLVDGGDLALVLGGWGACP
jgi:hypothetical protein